VQEHLLPSASGAPGAADVHATAYLDAALAGPRFDPDVRAFLLRGIGWLDDHAMTRHGRPFADIDPARREALPRDFGANATDLLCSRAKASE
jgi:hypothetical protein